MEALWNAVRYKVSADKNRYMKGQFDLDLTYITDRIIAMAFPADGVEAAYRNKIDDVASMLRESHRDHFMVYNLSERSYDYTKFDNNVHEWCGFPDHHSPPLKLLFTICKSIYSWLSADKKNVVIIHCLAGKGRTGTAIAAFFLYSGLFSDPQHALNYFACKRSTTNWGVTGPSQLRSVQYLTDIVYGGVVPTEKPLHLSYIHLSSAPALMGAIGAYALGKQAGCSPFIHIYCETDGKRLLYTSENENEEVKSYAANQPITFQVDITVRGDILIEMFHVTSFYRTEHVARLAFNAGMVRSTILRFARGDLDHACQDKRFPSNFYIDLGFEPAKNKKPLPIPEEDKWWETSPRGDGSVCFFDQSRLVQARNMSIATQSKVEKGGWLTKRGHKVKNWKRRWFVLRDPTLCYYKSPRDSTPAGVIILDDILHIVSEDDVSEGNLADQKPNFWFEIVTKKSSFLICAESEADMKDWVEAIEFVIQINEQNQRAVKLSHSQEGGVRLSGMASSPSTQGNWGKFRTSDDNPKVQQVYQKAEKKASVIEDLDSLSFDVDEIEEAIQKMSDEDNDTDEKKNDTTGKELAKVDSTADFDVLKEQKRNISESDFVMMENDQSNINTVTLPRV
eukprot:TRINITY_DN3016_c0_g1_i1.p1 TRINITY_DN3016_c0_g1~~TRINITY_DN3016_c0_g1_i1.p1  ORF type:complete len:622 (+),score=170.28 TRINITY_DN3016_c0_g1_i1:295-2160(+)